MPVVDLTSKDLWDTISQVLDADSEHICVLPMTTFIKPVRSVTVVQIDTRTNAARSVCPPGSKNLHAKPAVEPERPAADDVPPVDTTPDSDHSEPAETESSGPTESDTPELEPTETDTDVAEPISKPPEPPRIVRKREINSLVTDWTFLEDLQAAYNRDDELFMHWNVKGVLHGTALTFPLVSKDSKSDILVQVDTETGAVAHMPSRGRLITTVEPVDGMLYTFDSDYGKNVIDIDNFSDPEADMPVIVPATSALYVHINNWDFRDQLQAAYNTRTLRLPRERSAVMYKDTITFALESEGRSAILVRYNQSTNEVVGHKLGSAATYPHIETVEGTMVEFTDSDGENKETIDVASFGPTLDPPHEPLILTIQEVQMRTSKWGWGFANTLKEHYKRNESVGLSCEGVLYKNRLIFALSWRVIDKLHNDTLVQLDDTTGELLAFRDASIAWIERTEQVDDTRFKFTGRRPGEDIVDILEFGQSDDANEL